MDASVIVHGKPAASGVADINYLKKLKMIFNIGASVVLLKMLEFFSMDRWMVINGDTVSFLLL